MSIEERLRAALQRRAETVEARPDPEDLDQRAARGGRRRARALAGALALVLAVGPVAGFAVGRATSSDGDGDEPSVRADGGGGQPAPGGFGSEGSSSGTTGYLDIIGGGQFGPLERLFVRTTDDDIAIRAYRADTSGSCPADAPDCPPVPCFPAPDITAELSDEFAVGYGSGPFAADAAGATLMRAGYAGVPEGSPMAWAVVRVGPEIAFVRAVLDGAEDEMEPVDGVAVLAAHVPSPPGAGAEAVPSNGPVEPLTAFAPSGVIETVADDGTEASYDLATPPIEPSFDPDECEPAPPPTPPLPEPNGPPPADEEAARAEIIEAWSTGYNMALPDEVRLLVAEGGPEALLPLTEELRQNLPGVLDRQTVEVKEVRFLNETEAVVVYDIVIPDYTDAPGRIGRAKLIDGRWLIGLEGACADMALAGVICPPELMP